MIFGSATANPATGICGEVLFNLNRADVGDVISRVGGWVDACCRRRHEWCLWPQSDPRDPGEAHNWSFYQAQAAGVTVAAQGSYALPADFLRPLRLVLTYPAVSMTTNVLQLEGIEAKLGVLERLQQTFIGRDSDQPSERSSAYALQTSASTRLLWVFPVPDADYAYVLTYLQQYTSLVNPADTNELTNRFDQALIADATGTALMRLGKAAEAQPFIQLATQGWMEAMQSDRQVEEEEDLTLAVALDANADFDRPRPDQRWGGVPPLEERW